MYNKNDHRMEKEIKVALVIKTDGLEYDDRVRKEILTVQKLFPQIRFKVFIMLPDNKEGKGVSGYGVPYESIYIPARDKYPSAQKTFIKAYQFYKAVKGRLKEFDVIWVANVEASFFPMLLKKKRILWDLHEIPAPFLRNRLTKYVLKHTFSRCKLVIHANPQRIEYLNSIDAIDDMSKHVAIRNYPSFEDVDKEYDEAYHAFINWKGNRKCVYLQGLTFDGRASYESVSAVLRHPELVAVVIGKYDEEAKSRLIEEYGESSISDRIYFVGKIAQLKIPQYMSVCAFSMVFYKNIRPNNYYCEANRFYQAVMVGLPVVVGSNPPMREVVEQYGFGVSVEDDGRDVDAICEGIDRMLEGYDTFKENAIKNRHHLSWDTQEEQFERIINTVLGNSSC